MDAKPTTFSADLDARGLRFGIIVSRWNSLVTKELLGGALDAIERHGGTVADQVVVWAPGSFELPILAKALAKRGGIDGIIALGCVLRGETPHNEHIANEATKGLAQVGLEFDIPIGFGVLTPNTLEQALDRAGMKMGNKGAEAALAVVEVARLLAKLRG